MEYNWISDPPAWPLKGEQDFSLGAKATSYLLPATDPNAILEESSFELPDWMESRENLGLSDVKLFDDVVFPPNVENDPGFQDLEALAIPEDDDYVTTIRPEDDDYVTTIRPEDMLVPLSELGPRGVLAPAAPPAPTSPPKVVICTKRVLIPATSGGQFRASPVVRPVSPPKVAAPPDGCDALIDEVVQMAHLGDMDDLLLQLENSCSQGEPSDVSSWGSEPASPVSAGDLSPSQSINDSLFYSLLSSSVSGDDGSRQTTQTSESCAVSTGHPPPKSQRLSQTETTPKHEDEGRLSVPSPVPSAGSLSPGQSASYSFFCSPSPSDKGASGAGDSVGDWSPSEVHSYSRSPRRSRASKARAAPYPEDRRTRKKEQNKQAALRYRQKKRQEDDELMSKIEAEEERQKELKARYSNLKQELTYLKKIMREVFIVKGVISEDAFKKK